MERGEIIIYRSQEGDLKVDVLIRDESVWLTQYQIAYLFQTDRSSVTKHI